MDLKLCLAAILVTCAVQTIGLPVLRDAVYDQEHGQYAVALLSAEATIFRMRAYTLNLEINHTVKYIDIDIIAKLGGLDIDPIKIESLKTEMETRGVKVTDTITKIMLHTQTLIDHVNTITNNIENDPTKLSSDKARMEYYMENVNTYFLLGQDNVALSIEVIHLKIEVLLAGQSGPVVDEIMALMSSAETVLTTEQSKINASKLVMDAAGVEASKSLDILIASPPASELK